MERSRRYKGVSFVNKTESEVYAEAPARPSKPHWATLRAKLREDVARMDDADVDGFIAFLMAKGHPMMPVTMPNGSFKYKE